MKKEATLVELAVQVNKLNLQIKRLRKAFNAKSLDEIKIHVQGQSSQDNFFYLPLDVTSGKDHFKTFLNNHITDLCAEVVIIETEIENRERVASAIVQ